jgi:hypothetical protein
MGDGYCNNLREIEERLLSAEHNLARLSVVQAYHETAIGKHENGIATHGGELSRHEDVLRELIATIAKLGTRVDAMDAPKPSRLARSWAWVQDHTFGLFTG